MDIQKQLELYADDPGKQDKGVFDYVPETFQCSGHVPCKMLDQGNEVHIELFGHYFREEVEIRETCYCNLSICYILNARHVSVYICNKLNQTTIECVCSLSGIYSILCTLEREALFLLILLGYLLKKLHLIVIASSKLFQAFRYTI